tara:strand:- start:69 stop:188 length:120 start_codon:yes stop_codon:yes gene_type:complete
MKKEDNLSNNVPVSYNLDEIRKKLPITPTFRIIGGQRTQ